VAASGFVSGLGLEGSAVVAVYGAGGKSMIIAGLAQELVAAQNKVILTTTTKIYCPDDMPVITCRNLHEATVKTEKVLKSHPMVALGTSVLPDGKLEGIDSDWVGQLKQSGLAPYILVEADGAAGLPVKGFAAHEPVIPAAATVIVPVLGLDALTLPLRQNAVHRPKLLAVQAQAADNEPLNAGHLINSLKHMIALGQMQAPAASIVPVLNKVETVSDMSVINVIVQGMQVLPNVDRLLFTSAQEKEPVRFIFHRSRHAFLPRVSCVILAAGSSRRMGKDKLALRINNWTVLEHTVNNVLSADMGEVILVTQPDSWAASLFPPEKVKLVFNQEYLKGQASSLTAGLEAVSETSQAVIFALGDQPFVPPSVFSALLENYRCTLKPAVYPVFKKQRGNPVLFDRMLFPMLKKLLGDEGGRQILMNLPEDRTCPVEVSSAEILADIDTEEDYKKYINNS
jgi:molybdenum cofactor cytidylyltransferase